MVCNRRRVIQAWKRKGRRVIAEPTNTPSRTPLGKDIPLLVFAFVEREERELADMGTVLSEIQNFF